LPQFRCREDYVRTEDLSGWEEEQLRALLELHFQLTGSYRAERLLSAAGRLAMVRVQPLQMPRTLEEVWQSAWPETQDSEADESIGEATAAAV
jgi:glutamate synthase domain-containing protein 3